jgi:hypothetical protein
MLDEAWEDFTQMRKEIKHPVTPTIRKRLEKKLDELAGGNERMKAAILNRSVEMGWRGLFPLTGDALDAFRKSEMERMRNRSFPCEYCGKPITASGKIQHEERDCPNYRGADEAEVRELIENFRFGA